jgi:hypothetical protein
MFVNVKMYPEYNNYMIIKIKIRVKMAGGVAQELEHWPSRCKALNSNASTAKN